MFFETYSTQLIQSAIHIPLFLLFRWITIQFVKKYSKKYDRAKHRTRRVIRYANFTFVSFILIGLVIIWGGQFEDLGLILSSVFAVIGIGFFAQWSILSNITSGVIMFFTFPYKLGDYIKIQDKDFPCEGIIDEIKLFHTIIKSGYDEVITYPNSMMLQKGITIVKSKSAEQII